MTNDTPPKACLADFGFTTMVLDPQNPMSSSLKLEGGTMTFMAPELLAPSKYGLNGAIPTREGDIYAFGLVILQVVTFISLPLLFPSTICQVLTGELPFSGIKSLELGFHVWSGVRPFKPDNAEDIGISESLWKLIQKCWDGQKARRPKIQEVVDGVGNAAANWHGLIPPSTAVHVEDSYEEESEDELKHGEPLCFHIVPCVFRLLVQLGYSSLIEVKVHRLLERALMPRPAYHQTPQPISRMTPRSIPQQKP